MQSGKAIFGALALALMVGCTTASTDRTKGPPEVEDSPLVPGTGTADGTVEPATEAVGTTGTFTDDDVEGSPLADVAGADLPLVIYFDFDSSEVHPDDRVVVEAHAQFLFRDANAQVVLEGHADERGSREYNVALGERRANSVRDMLRLLGVADQQIRAVSYGEERPAVTGQDEGSWSRNRRVEFAYVTR